MLLIKSSAAASPPACGPDPAAPPGPQHRHLAQLADRRPIKRSLIAYDSQ